LSFSLDSQSGAELLETLGLVIPLAVLLALAGVLVDAFRGSRPIPRAWRLVAKFVLGLLLLALAPALYILFWGLTEAVGGDKAFLYIAAFITLALGMGLFAWSFLLRAARGVGQASKP
jgi:hypothetical protein